MNKSYYDSAERFVLQVKSCPIRLTGSNRTKYEMQAENFVNCRTFTKVNSAIRNKHRYIAH